MYNACRPGPSGEADGFRKEPFRRPNLKGSCSTRQPAVCMQTTWLRNDVAGLSAEVWREARPLCGARQPEGSSRSPKHSQPHFARILPVAAVGDAAQLHYSSAWSTDPFAEPAAKKLPFEGTGGVVVRRSEACNQPPTRIPAKIHSGFRRWFRQVEDGAWRAMWKPWKPSIASRRAMWPPNRRRFRSIIAPTPPEKP